MLQQNQQVHGRLPHQVVDVLLNIMDGIVLMMKMTLYITTVSETLKPQKNAHTIFISMVLTQELQPLPLEAALQHMIVRQENKSILAHVL
jgi:hypothetical protein